MLLLPRYLSRAGVASRKQAEQAVFDGRVTVNGRVVRDVLATVSPGRDRVALDGAMVEEKSSFTWLAMNKPRGVLTTTSDPEGRPTVMGLLKTPPPGLAPVGRLDQDSGGLLLLTDEHALAAALLAPETHVLKVYRVKVRGHPSAEALARLGTETVEIEGLRLGPLQLEVDSTTNTSSWLTVRLAEGKNRQIRRRLEAEGHPVLVLVRTGFGPIALGDLPPGQVRPLSPNERASLASAVKSGRPG